MPLNDEYGTTLSTVDETADEEAQEAYSESVAVSAYEIQEELETLGPAYNEWVRYRNGNEAVFRKPSRVLTAAYPAACEALDGIDINHETVEAFIKDTALRAADGVFISAIANTLEDSVTLPGLAGVDYVGVRNTADIAVDGDTGDYAGVGMMAGELHVDGDAGRQSGRLMQGGVLRIKGDGDGGLGMDMEGGEIYVDGTFYLSRRHQRGWTGGTIYRREEGEYVPFIGGDA